MPVLYKAILLLLALLVGSLTQGTSLDLVLAFSLILIMGIPHGATDHYLFNLLTEKKNLKKPGKVFILIYLSLMAAYSALWYFFPALSLVIFLVISAYHFGETQFLYLKKEDWPAKALYLSWGTLVLLLILRSDTDFLETLIVPYLIDPSVFQWVELYGMYCSGFLLMATLVLLLVVRRNRIPKELAELAIIYILSSNLSLLLSFAIFFAFWHSRDSAVAQLVGIRKTYQKFLWRNWLSLTLPFTAISVVGIALLVGVFYFISSPLPLITLFFILIALITLPHVFVMSRFYQRA